MRASRTLDVLIARKIFGVKSNDLDTLDRCPNYSDSIEAAWLIVRHFKGIANFSVTLLDMPVRYQATLTFHMGQGEYKEFTAEEDTAPIAIVVAALKYAGLEL